jgi:hypothetical protein
MASNPAIADRAFAGAPETWSSFPVLPAFAGRSPAGGGPGVVQRTGVNVIVGRVKALIEADCR